MIDNFTLRIILIPKFQNDDMLKEMRKSQHVACRESWYDNMTRTVFQVSHSMTGSEEQQDIEEKCNSAIAELQKGFEDQIQGVIQKGNIPKSCRNKYSNSYKHRGNKLKLTSS